MMNGMMVSDAMGSASMSVRGNAFGSRLREARERLGHGARSVMDALRGEDGAMDFNALITPNRQHLGMSDLLLSNMPRQAAPVSARRGASISDLLDMNEVLPAVHADGSIDSFLDMGDGSDAHGMTVDDLFSDEDMFALA
ncbi:hypothetical protein EMO89_00385 [Bifidobacterium tissieri]|uniref:Uncharacterized protein n=2 Tax=Bifidobacterium TaxID=1678 RepID=A0A7Y0HVU6_9BIFI|nr:MULTISPECIES: hypothetical protein [Bifidobacterium]KAA8832021.1 hypothetical protein EMO89_00385 [Bifidobacterium tissieri]NMM97576.1 hypothetical protein [Bifidobacterium sp. DSM 109959]